MSGYQLGVDASFMFWPPSGRFFAGTVVVVTLLNPKSMNPPGGRFQHGKTEPIDDQLLLHGGNIPQLLNHQAPDRVTLIRLRQLECK